MTIKPYTISSRKVLSFFDFFSLSIRLEEYE